MHICLYIHSHNVFLDRPCRLCVRVRHSYTCVHSSAAVLPVMPWWCTDLLTICPKIKKYIKNFKKRGKNNCQISCHELDKVFMNPERAIIQMWTAACLWCIIGTIILQVDWSIYFSTHRQSGHKNLSFTHWPEWPSAGLIGKVNLAKLTSQTGQMQEACFCLDMLWDQQYQWSVAVWVLILRQP